MSKYRVMEIRHFVTLLLLVFIFIAGCKGGNFRKDFFEIHDLSADAKLQKSLPKKYLGMEAVVGPLPGSRGIRFNESAADISLTNRKFAYIANFIQTSSDLTFAVYFQIMGIKKNDRHAYFPFFVMSDKNLEHRYFSVGLEAKQSRIIVEGKKGYGKHEWAVYIEQWVASSKSSEKTSLKLGEKMELGKWTSLVVRIKNESVSVLMNCKEVVSGKLIQGRIGRFSYEGKMTFSQMWLKEREDERKQFVGSIYEPQLINTPKGYNYWTPCRKHEPSVVVPEPRPDTYDPTKFRDFQDMESQPMIKPLLYCKAKSKNGKVITLLNNGDASIYAKCYSYKCEDGKVKMKYKCPPCKDNGKEYRVLDVWHDKSDPCIEKKCVYRRKVTSKTIVCKKLTCPADEQYLKKGTCCKRCRGDDCTQGKEWYAGCARKCALGVEQMCKKGEEKKACWCPAGTAMNHENTECIPTGECKCVTGSKVYLPGQSTKRSNCSNCICSHGLLTCFHTCS